MKNRHLTLLLGMIILFQCNTASLEEDKQRLINPNDEDYYSENNLKSMSINSEDLSFASLAERQTNLKLNPKRNAELYKLRANIFPNFIDEGDNTSLFLKILKNKEATWEFVCQENVSEKFSILKDIKIQFYKDLFKNMLIFKDRDQNKLVIHPNYGLKEDKKCSVIRYPSSKSIVRSKFDKYTSTLSHETSRGNLILSLINQNNELLNIEIRNCFVTQFENTVALKCIYVDPAGEKRDLEEFYLISKNYPKIESIFRKENQLNFNTTQSIIANSIIGAATMPFFIYSAIRNTRKISPILKNNLLTEVIKDSIL